MPYYRQVGEVPAKRHIQFHRPDGALYAEELMGQEGFASDSALLYHDEVPTAIVDAETVLGKEPRLVANDPLLPRHLRTLDTPVGGDPVTGRHLLLGNDDVHVSVVQATESSPNYRNALGDELVYVHSGSARLDTVFGQLEVGPGDYVVIPQSATHRWHPGPDGSEPLTLLVMEATGHVVPPARYLSERGQFVEGAPFCERDLHGPTEPFVDLDAEPTVLVRHRGGLTRYTYATSPYDVVGWDGCLYPYRFNIGDFEPLTGQIHLPPTVHQTFAGPNFVVCSFVPRLFDYHPLSIPAPYNHANTDTDEVLFYAEGDFMSRKDAGIDAGSISLHPAGFIHGPQPGSVEASIGQRETIELAVMIDTFRPLSLGAAALVVEDASYPWSWSGRHLTTTP